MTRMPRPPGLPDCVAPATRESLLAWGYPEDAVPDMLSGASGHDFYLSVEHGLEVTVSHDDDPLDRAEHDEPRFYAAAGRGCECVDWHVRSERWEDVLPAVLAHIGRRVN